MVDSQGGLQLRQRGLAVAAGGMVVQLIGIFAVMAAAGWPILLLPLVASAVASTMSYVNLKDRTGTSNTASVITVLLAGVAAIVHSGWGGVLIILIGAVALHLGNKQLAAGIKF